MAIGGLGHFSRSPKEKEWEHYLYTKKSNAAAKQTIDLENVIARKILDLEKGFPGYSLFMEVEFQEHIEVH